MGAIASGGIRVLNSKVLNQLSNAEKSLREATAKEEKRAINGLVQPGDVQLSDGFNGDHLAASSRVCESALSFAPEWGWNSHDLAGARSSSFARGHWRAAANAPWILGAPPSPNGTRARFRGRDLRRPKFLGRRFLTNIPRFNQESCHKSGWKFYFPRLLASAFKLACIASFTKVFRSCGRNFRELLREWKAA